MKGEHDGKGRRPMLIVFAEELDAMRGRGYDGVRMANPGVVGDIRIVCSKSLDAVVGSGPGRGPGRSWDFVLSFDMTACSSFDGPSNLSVSRASPSRYALN